MVRSLAPAVILLLALSLAGCSREDTPMSPTASLHATSSPHLDAELAAGAVMLACGWDFDPEVELPASLAALLDKCPPGSIIQDFQREVITGDIAHYSLVLSVGPGQYDVIGLHRVVRERRPNQPIRAQTSLFLIHGGGKNFSGCFLPGLVSPLLPDDFGFAVYMAQHGIDVWGLDHSYTLVPGGLEDHSFAAGWGMDQVVDNIDTSVSIARLVRLFTGNGLRKMTLLGYSQGAPMGYALLNRQTQLPRGLRSIGAWIPVEGGLDYDHPEVAEHECAFLSGYVDLYNDGIYGFDDDPDGFYYDLGYLAQTAPDEPSPYYEDLTNLQVFLYFNSASNVPSSPGHWWAASFDDDGVPLALTYTTLLMATEFWIYWAPMHWPTRLMADQHAICCGDGDAVWERHLGQINLPVFCLDAAGGFGPGQSTTLLRLVRADVTHHIVQLMPPDDAWLDFAHIDLFTAENAPEVAWQPTLAWLEGRQGREEPDAWAVTEALSADDLAHLRAVDWSPPSTGQWLGHRYCARPVAPAQAPLELRSLRARHHCF
jgi:predicted esterase